MRTIHSSTLGAFIVKERKALGCPVTTFCRECGITTRTYYRLLGEKIHPRQLCKSHQLPVRHETA